MLHAKRTDIVVVLSITSTGHGSCRSDDIGDGKDENNDKDKHESKEQENEDNVNSFFKLLYER